MFPTTLIHIAIWTHFAASHAAGYVQQHTKYIGPGIDSNAGLVGNVTLDDECVQPPCLAREKTLIREATLGQKLGLDDSSDISRGCEFAAMSMNVPKLKLSFRANDHITLDGLVMLPVAKHWNCWLLVISDSRGSAIFDCRYYLPPMHCWGPDYIDAVCVVASPADGHEDAKDIIARVQQGDVRLTVLSENYDENGRPRFYPEYSGCLGTGPY